MTSVRFRNQGDLIQQSRRCWGVLEPLHVIGYFAPETIQAYVDLGLHRRLAYFAARSAAMGPVGPEMTIATFYVFAPALVRKALPAAWEVTTPERLLDARHAGVLLALRRAVGDPDVTEALELAREATRGLTAAGRPLYAAHSSLDWPDDPLLALWHAATLIREHRGDGHVAVLLGAGLDPVESLVLGGLFSGNTDFVQTSRGWTEQEWSAGEARLRERGLLAEAGGLTDEGRTFRQRIEDETDALATAGFEHLGPEGCQRLRELMAPLRRDVLASAILPDWISRRARADS